MTRTMSRSEISYKKQSNFLIPANVRFGLWGKLSQTTILTDSVTWAAIYRVDFATRNKYRIR